VQYLYFTYAMARHSAGSHVVSKAGIDVAMEDLHAKASNQHGEGVVLSGQVFNLKNLEDFNGIYKIVEPTESVGSGGTRATIKNQKGVVVNVIATAEGNKFTLGLTA
jgi:hypothetical protein